MLIIGVTGVIGSGKSTVSEMFAKLGARVIDADKIAHKLMAPYGSIWWSLIEYYGQGIIRFGPDTIDRSRLGNFVFNDSFQLVKLNSLLHPPIIEEIKKQVKCSSEKKRKIVVVDAPLLIETGLHKYMDVVILVVVEEKVQIERLGKRSPELLLNKINQRKKYQMRQKEKVEFADVIVDNNGDLEHTQNQVVTLFHKLTKESTKC